MSPEYLMNNILRETSRIALIKSLQDRPSHGKNQLDATLRHVQLGVIITDSRLDDELSVATIEFHRTPQWLSEDYSSFPKFTSLGTIWNAVDRLAIDEHGRTEFIRAVIKGGSHIEFLYAEMLAEFDDTNVNVQDDRGRSALHWACVLSHHYMVRLCLSIPDCDTSLKDLDGLTAFDISRCSGGGDETIPNMFYRSIMEMEGHAPQTALLRILTITSEPSTATNSDKPVFPGQAMFVPVEDANEPLVAALIARGIDFTATNDAGDTALHMAAAKADNLGIVSKLVNAGWNVNAVGNEGATPLHCAARARDVDVVKLLLAHEANAGAKDIGGNTPLKLAEEIHCEDLVVLLQDATDLAARAVLTPEPVMNEISLRSNNLDRLDWRGMSALHHAARDGHTQTVSDLLAGGASIDISDRQQRTPLHLAVEKGHTETVSALLAGGASTDLSDKNQETPLHWAAQYRRTEIVLALLAGGANINSMDMNKLTPLHRAAQYGRTETVSTLLAGGASTDLSDSHHRTPLHWAAEYGRTEIVLALLAGGAKINSMDMDKDTPLNLAAQHGRTEIVSMLLAGGASTDSPDRDERTPLHWAVKAGHTETSSALLAGGANIDSLDVNRYTPLHLAAQYGRTEAVSVLLAGGARIDVEDASGRTALGLAVDGNRKDVIKILRARSTRLGRLGSALREQLNR